MVEIKPFDMAMIQELGNIGYSIDKSHPQIGQILDEILANNSVVAAAGHSKTYSREYTRCVFSYAPDDNMKNILAGPDIRSIMSKYGC